MTTRTWLMFNAALLILAGIAVKVLMDTPAEIVRQRKLTQRALDFKPSPRELISKGTKHTTLAMIRKKAQEERDTWPAIRRGSLNNIWQMTLFSEKRSEAIGSNSDDPLGQEKEEELPAPPNFELIGILTANQTKVAIIEFKTASVRQSYQSRRRTYGRQPAPEPQTPANSFAPSFATVHVKDQLADTGYEIKEINEEERSVILNKNGFDYKLALKQDNANATKRRDSQLTYAKAVKERARAQAAKTQAQKKPENDRKQQPPPMTNRLDHGSPMRRRGNIPINATQGVPRHYQGTSNQRRMIPARQR